MKKNLFVHLLSGLLFPALLALARLCPAADEIVLGQSTALSGMLASQGLASSDAARVYFEHINRQGGIHGRKIRLISLDDAFDPAKTLVNVRQLIEQDKVFALFGLLGTAANSAAVPLIGNANIVNFGPLSGAESLRAPHNRLVFHVRAGYAQELHSIAEHLAQRGLNQVAAVVQDNAFGQEGLAALEAALAQRKMKLSGTVRLGNDAADLEQALQDLARMQAKTVVTIAVGKSTVDFIHAYKQRMPDVQICALSVMASPAALAALGKDSAGVIVAQVAPYPFSATSGIVGDYQKLMRRAGINDWSYAGIEGYLNARVLVEGLRRAGRELSTASLIAALEGMRKVNLDGFQIDYDRNKHQGSRYVELTVISRDGRYLR